MKVLFQHIITLLSCSCLLFTGCLKERILEETPAEGGLMLHPSVVSLTTKTTIDADGTRDENNLGSYLDVFIKGNDTDNTDFWKEYHLTNRDFSNPNGELLHVNWKAEGYQVGKKYNVYVVVNGPALAHDPVGSFYNLRALTHTDTDIFRLKYYAGDQGSVNNNSYAYTSSKAFLMDGFVENWKPSKDKSTQTIEADNMARAAAKIVVNVKFDQDFLNELLAAGEIPQDPSFRYVNFATCSSVIRSETAGDPALATGRWLSLNSVNRDVEVDSSTPEYSYNASLTTYSYAYSWGADNLSQGLGAPYVMISVLYQVGDSREYHYYRIPVRPTGETSLERNHIYMVTATIDNRGSYKVVDAMEPANLNYQVLEWTEENSEITHVTAKKRHFFMVMPLTQVLRGEGVQTAVLKYYAPEGASISIENIPETQLIADDATEPSFEHKALYIDKDGNPQDTESTVSISKDETAQTITVRSTALANRASTFIRFRATYSYEEEGTPQTITQDIYIRHFPTDNISSIPGWYSYKNDGDFIEYSFNPETDGWVEEGWNKWEDYEEVSCTYNEYNGAKFKISISETEGTPSDYTRAEEKQEIERNAFLQAIPAPGFIIKDYTNRIAANSERNAIKNGDYYYWGEDPVIVNLGSDYDYYIAEIGLGNSLFKYSHYYRRKGYVKGTYSARRYHRHLPTSWVRWEYDSKAPSINSKTFGEGFDLYFDARYYDSSEKKIFKIAPDTTNDLAVKGTDTGQENNHMYIVQISNTSDNYTIGYPVMNNEKQSDDRTVSPAFMLASQLGSTNPVTAARKAIQTPAVHCSQYVEVGLDGTVYDGWRLPTKDEIEIINQYQSRTGVNAVEISTIFTGHYYSTIDGSNQAITGASGGDVEYLRCVRDLTPAEVEALNKIK